MTQWNPLIAPDALRRTMPICTLFLLALASCGSAPGPLDPRPITVVPGVGPNGGGGPEPKPTPSPTPSPVETPAPPSPWGRVAGQPDGFNADFYKRQNPDVVAAGMDLLYHYRRYGRAEGRLPYEGAPPPPVDVVAEGDSISVFWAGNHTGMFAAKHTEVVIRPLATSGAAISTIKSRLSLIEAHKPRIVTVLVGANDLGGATYPSPEAWLEALWSYTEAVKALGAKVAVSTLLPQCASANANWPARRAVVNAAIRNAVGTKIDAVIDYAAHPRLAPDGAGCDKALFNDGLHPNSDPGGGQETLFSVYRPVVEQLLTK